MEINNYLLEGLSLQKLQSELQFQFNYIILFFFFFLQLFVAVLALSVSLVQSVPVGPAGVPGSEATAQIVSENRETSFDGSFKNS